MCTYAASLEKKYKKQGIEQGLKALVRSLKEYIHDFETLYKAVVKNEEYKDVSRDEVMKYYNE